MSTQKVDDTDHPVKHDIDETLRTQRVRLYLWVTASLSVGSIPIALTVGTFIGVIAISTAILFCGVGLHALHVRKNSVIASIYYLIASYLALVLTCIGDGMGKAPVLWVISCIPLAASFLLGIRAAIVNVGIAVVITIAMHVLSEVYHVPALREQDPTETLFLRLMQVGVIGGYALTSLRSWRAQLEQLASQQRELKTARYAAEEASRAKSQFLANMSHEIRTPMNGILGMTQHMMDAPLGQEEERESLEIVHRCSENLLSLLNDILDLSKVEAGKLEFAAGVMDLDDVVHEVHEVFSAKAKAAGLELVVKTPGVKEYHSSDANRIRQLLSNLVGNAIKFSDRGRVSVEVTHGELVATETEQIRHVCVAVSDQGIGIPQADLARLFEDFEQVSSVEDNRGGTGLGLAISRRFAQAMGGKLRVESEVGVGTVFYLDLPMPVVPRSKVPKGLLSRSDERDLDLTNCRVLVVDDNLVNCKVAAVHLRRLGAVVDLAHDGQEAIDKTARLTYQLVLMDIRMPGKDGLQATREIRAMGGVKAKIPIVALTAAAFEDDRLNCEQAGMNGFLSKPFRRNELVECLLQLEIRPPHEQEGVITLRRKAAV